MMVQVDLYQLIGWAGAGAASLVGVIWAVLKALFAQMERRLDERFSHLEGARMAEQVAWGQRFDTLSASTRQIEQDLSAFKLEAANRYAMRDDTVRDIVALQSRIETMSDRLMGRIDALGVSLRGGRGGG